MLLRSRHLQHSQSIAVTGGWNFASIFGTFQRPFFDLSWIFLVFVFVEQPRSFLFRVVAPPTVQDPHRTFLSFGPINYTKEPSFDWRIVELVANSYLGPIAVANVVGSDKSRGKFLFSAQGYCQVGWSQLSHTSINIIICCGYLDEICCHLAEFASFRRWIDAYEFKCSLGHPSTSIPRMASKSR